MKKIGDDKITFLSILWATTSLESLKENKCFIRHGQYCKRLFFFNFWVYIKIKKIKAVIQFSNIFECCSKPR